MDAPSRIERLLAGGEGPGSDAAAQDRAWQELVAGPLRTGRVAFEEQWRLYERVFKGRTAAAGPPLAWTPAPDVVSRSNLAWLMKEAGVRDWAALHRWSVEHRAEFWERTVRRLGIRFSRPPRAVLDDSKGVERVEWLPRAEWNAADPCFQADPDAVAIRTGREGSAEVEEVSYRELESLANRVANGLAEAGLHAGDAVALYLPMNVSCVAAYLGIVRAGMAVVSIPDSFAPREVRKRLAIGQAKAIVTVDSFRRGDATIDLYAKVRAASAPKAVVIPGGGPAPTLRPGDVSWAALLSDDDRFTSVKGPPERLTNVLFSSGTTGEPKGIPWTQLSPIKAAADGHWHQDIHPEDVVAWPTNIGWMMGPWLIYATFYGRATMALYEGLPTSAGFCRFVQDAGVTVLGLVPSIVRKWRETGATNGVDWSRVRLYSSTGEASNVPEYLWLMSLTGYRTPIVEYCGGTEIAGGHITGTVVQPASPATFTTPALGLDFVVLGADGEPVAEGGMGELYVVPPSIGLSQTLLNKDHHEVYYAGCPRGPKGELLRRHGDEVQRLGRGFWQAHGRADDTMNLGGIKVSSVELERAMNGHAAVSETAAVAVVPEGGGADELVVYAVARDAKRPPEPAELRQELQARIKEALNPLFRIHDVVLIDALPRTPSNKVMRRELRKEYSARRVPP